MNLSCHSYVKHQGQNLDDETVAGITENNASSTPKVIPYTFWCIKENKLQMETVWGKS